MKIDNQVPQPIPTGPSSSPAPASGTVLQEGQVYQARVKSLTRNEAEIKIGDQTIRVQIEGKMPQGEYIAVQVKNLQGKLPVVKVVADTPRGHQTGPDPAGILRSLGFKPAPELISATRVLLDQGIPLNREVVGHLAAFLDTASGTPAQKLTTIRAVVNKQLPITRNHLQPVHTALHGPGPAGLLAALAELEPQSGGQPAQAAPTPVDSPTGPTSHSPTPAAETGKQSMAGRDLQAQATLLRQAAALLARTADLPKALNQVQELFAASPVADPEITRTIEPAITAARQLAAQGLPATGRELLAHTLAQALAKLQPQSGQHQPAQAAPTPVDSPTGPTSHSPIPAAETGKQSMAGRDLQAQAALLRQAMAFLTRTADLPKALNQVQELFAASPVADPEITQTIEPAITAARQLAAQGLPAAGRELLAHTLAQALTQALAGALAETADTPTGNLATPNANTGTSLIPPITNISPGPVFFGSPGQPGAQPLSNPTPIPPSIPPAPETTIPQTLPATPLQPVDPAPPPGPAAPPEYLVAEALAGLQLPAKSFVVQTVTRQLHQAAEEFRSLKREITRNLDSVLQIVNSTKNPVLAQARPLLETAIDRLDNAILKSPITLFTDMATEKHLLTASSRLALARKFLAEGNNTRAAAIVTEVKTQLEQLNWRPAAVKVQHLLTRPVFANANPTTPAPARLTPQMAPFTPAGPEPAPREIYEFIRTFGLNHDSDAAQALAKASAGPNPNPEDLNQNLKAALLQLTGTDRDTGLKPEFRPLAEQLLNSLTGQQLLSKADPATGLQTMFFHLPVLIEDRQANLKVWVNSRNNRQKIDWENCNLYFLIDTQKLGETGIWIAAADRNLTVTVRNDHPDCRDIVAPLTAKYKARLEAVGYQINDINFTRLREPASGDPSPAPAPVAVPLPATGPLKGVDCKI